MKKIKLLDILKDITRDPFTGELQEGLIRTVPIEQAVRVFKKNTQNYSEVELRSTEDVIEVGFKLSYPSIPERNYVSGTVYDSKISKILTLAQNLGYFPSTVKYKLSSDSNYQSEKYNPSKFRELILDREPEYLIFRFEAKYDRIVEVPRYVYHITSQQFVDSIKAVGLKPKNLDKRAKHIERVYVSFSKEDSEILFKSLKNHFGKGKGVELIIDTDPLKGPFYEDPNFTGRGAYTYQNIPPHLIRSYKPIEED
jgi:hypothetical protein